MHERVKKMSEKHGSIASCIPAMYALTSCDTVPKMFGIRKVSALNVLRRNSLNHLGNLDALPEVIPEEENTFVGWYHGAKNSVDVAEIRLVCPTKFILRPLYKKQAKKGKLINFGGNIQPRHCVLGSQLFIYLWQVLIHLFHSAHDPL